MCNNHSHEACQSRRQEDRLVVGRLLAFTFGLALVGLVDVWGLFELALAFIGVAGIFAVMLAVGWLVVAAIEFFCYPEE